MKKIKIVSVIFVVCALLLMTGCGTKNVEGSLEDIMTKLYADINEDELPMMLTNTQLNTDNIANYIGTSDVDFKEGIVSESMTGSIPHSVVLLRVNDNANIESIKQTIKDSANPRKWICVEAENVYVESNGNLIILIMSNDIADKIRTNFNNL